VKSVGGATIVRQEQEPDRGLADESSLRQREGVRDDTARAGAAPVRHEAQHRRTEADDEDDDSEYQVHRYHRAQAIEEPRDL
jgi:hypothetical protein